MVGAMWGWLTWDTRGVSDCLAGSPLTTIGPVSLVYDANDALVGKYYQKTVQLNLRRQIKFTIVRLNCNNT